ncbi:MAG: glycosyltransferase family 39 protein, partial [Acidobacteriia bacterium]|nr:glycosyltransferase family 39 protein [Terriglobia bacterium]
MQHRPERWELFVLALILSAFAAVLVSLAWKTGVTIDEPAHVLSAHLYWIGEDNLAAGDMPPAIKILGGWVSHLAGLPIPRDNPAVWSTQHEWPISLEMMSRMSHAQIHNVFFYSRLPLLVFPLACALLVWYWGRQLFSPITALLMMGVFSLSPTVLGHGCLFKNDLAASFSYLLFWYCAWRFWKEPQLRQAVFLAVALLIAILAKFSLLILVPLAPAIILVRCFTLRPIPYRLAALSLLVLFLVPYAGVL